MDPNKYPNCPEPDDILIVLNLVIFDPGVYILAYLFFTRTLLISLRYVENLCLVQSDNTYDQLKQGDSRGEDCGNGDDGL